MKTDDDGGGRLTPAAGRGACVTSRLCSYSRYADLLDDILASILFGFYQDSLPERTFSDFLHLFVLVHVNGRTGSSCCVCTGTQRHVAKRSSSSLTFDHIDQH